MRWPHGSWFAELMDMAGVKNSELAAHLGMNPGAVTKWRAGERRPGNQETLEAMLDFVGVSEQDLVVTDRHAYRLGFKFAVRVMQRYLVRMVSGPDKKDFPPGPDADEG